MGKLELMAAHACVLSHLHCLVFLVQCQRQHLALPASANIGTAGVCCKGRETSRGVLHTHTHPTPSAMVQVGGTQRALTSR